MKYKFIVEKNENEVSIASFDSKDTCICEALNEFCKRTAKIDESTMKISAHDCLSMGMTLSVEDKDENKISVKVVEDTRMIYPVFDIPRVKMN